jgi:predicted RND superfamily exporter protein
VAFGGAAKLHFSHSGMSWFPDDHIVRVDMEKMNEDLGGGNPFEFLIDSGQENGLHEPAFLLALEEMQALAEETTVGLVSVGQSISIVDIVKETNQALHEGSKEFYKIPASRDLISQEILLFENSGTDDLEDVTTAEHRSARMMLTVPFVDALHYPPFGETLLESFRRIAAAHGLNEVSVSVTGFLTLAGETFDLLLVSMARSYTLALSLIGILMILLIGNLRLGLLSVFPNITPIIFALGLMGWFGVPLDISTMLLGSILIGIAVDDTIHFVHNYNRYYRQTGSSERAVELTLLSTGRAMLFTSIVLSMGFFVYMGATLSNIIAFGWLNGLGVLLAFLADVVLMPALVVLAASKSKGSSE